MIPHQVTACQADDEDGLHVQAQILALYDIDDGEVAEYRQDHDYRVQQYEHDLVYIE